VRTILTLRRPTDGHMHTRWAGARVARWSHPTVAQNSTMPVASFDKVKSTNPAYRFPLSLLPRFRGRRWPTGRMRGLSRKAACEKVPLTLALSPESFATALPCFGVCNHANDSGERGHNSAVRPDNLRINPNTLNSTVLRSPVPACGCGNHIRHQSFLYLEWHFWQVVAIFVKAPS
jgi:hypothetical protein